MGIFYSICQLLQTGILVMYMFIGGFIINHISEIRWILKLSAFNFSLNFNEVYSILVRKVQFWYNNKNYSEFKELQ